ncbi:hypothetical protein CBR_g48241 [Chara braunii]|uniref:Uncharacterized protein n=1 Tax=Chara braunii TaxID=69332 RepID=A0A388M2J7_CHABU|nr:hypothetical protein CBR_g48241 [Chara braunii]|eukprot:GBG88712.1 hypothetical protein CBR_g48241 [Chara braunii]
MVPVQMLNNMFTDQVNLRDAEGDLQAAETVVQMMETGQRVEELIKQGRLVLDWYVAEGLEKLDRERKEKKEERVGRKEPQLSVELMEENIRQLENTLKEERRKIEEYRRLKEQQEEEEKVMEELRQRFHYEEAGSEVASILQSIMVYLMRLEKKIEKNTAAVESMTRMMKGNDKVVYEEVAKGEEDKKPPEKLMKDATKRTYCSTAPVEPESQVAFSTSCLGKVGKEWVLAEANAAGLRILLVAESKSGKYNYRHFRDLALQREQMTAQVKGSYASVVKSGPVGGYGKRVLWRKKRQDHMLVLFDDETVEKLPLDESEGGGGNGGSESGKGDVTAVMANTGGQNQWKKKKRPRSFPEHPDIAFGRPWKKMNMTREEWQSKMDNRQCLKCGTVEHVIACYPAFRSMVTKKKLDQEVMMVLVKRVGRGGVEWRGEQEIGGQARMIAKVKVEWRHAGGRTDNIVVGDLGGGDRLIPIVLMWMTILPQDSLESIIHLLGLSIGLWVECSAKLEHGFVGFKEVCPKLCNEARVTVADDVLGETVVACEMVEEENGDVLGVMQSGARDEVSVFSQATNNDIDAIMSVVGLGETVDEVHGDGLPPVGGDRK